MRRFFWLIFFLFPAALTAQLDSLQIIVINKVKYVAPNVTNLVLLYNHIDEPTWDKGLFAHGYNKIEGDDRRFALQFTKGFTKHHFQEISFDDRFGVVDIIWMDWTGENSMIGDLEESLKPFYIQENSDTRFYGITHNNTRYSISVSVRHNGKALIEETTIELAR